MSSIEVKEGTQQPVTVEQQINTELAKIGITTEGLEKMKSFLELKVVAHIDENGNLIEDKAKTKEVHDARIQVKTARVAISKLFKEKRDSANSYIKANTTYEKKVLATIEPVEEHLLTEEAIPSNLQDEITQREEKKREDTLKARVEELKTFGMGFLDQTCLSNGEINLYFSDLKFINDDAYAAILESVKTSYEKTLADKKAKQDADDLAKEQLRLQGEQQAKMKADLDKQAKELQDAKDELEKEKTRLENEKKAAAELKFNGRKNLLINAGLSFDNVAFVAKGQSTSPLLVEDVKLWSDEKFDSMLSAITESINNYNKQQEQKRLDDIDKAAKDKIEADRVAKENADKLAKEKDEKRIARMPDKKRLNEFIVELASTIDLKMQGIELKNEDGKNAFENIKHHLKVLIPTLQKEIENL